MFRLIFLRMRYPHANSLFKVSFIRKSEIVTNCIFGEYILSKHTQPIQRKFFQNIFFASFVIESVPLFCTLKDMQCCCWCFFRSCNQTFKQLKIKDKRLLHLYKYPSKPRQTIFPCLFFAYSINLHNRFKGMQSLL